MSYVNEVFPVAVSQQARGGPRMGLAVTESPDSGAQERARRWPSYRWEYEAGVGLHPDTTLDPVYAHYLTVGPENSFPFFDPRDYTSAPDNRSDPASSGTLDQPIGVGNGTNTVFQLSKTYAFGSRSYLRNIRKPLSAQPYRSLDGTTKTAQVYVSVGGTLQTLGTHYSLDTSTGIIVFVTPPGNGVAVRASFVFYVPVFYGADFVYKATRDAVNAGRIPELPLVEDTSQASMTPDLPYMGGGDTITLSASALYDYAWGRSVFLLPTANGFSITLPDINELPFGGPIFHFNNLGVVSPRTITFKNRATAATEFSLPIGKWANVYIRSDSGRVWTAAGN